MGYLEIARRLPRPTLDQCEAFARGMSGKHSWYKHLPIAPTVPFRFLIAPRAPDTSDYGSQLMDPRTVHVRSASEHERTYGFWDCIAPYAMGAGLDPETRARAEAARGFWVHIAGSESERVDVPDDLIAAGTVRVNAFVDPRSRRMAPSLWSHSADRYGVTQYLLALGIDAPSDFSELRDLWEATITEEHRKDVRDRTLAAMVGAMSRVAMAIWGPSV